MATYLKTSTGAILKSINSFLLSGYADDPMYQDTAETTLSTNGDPVASIRDRVGNYQFIQATGSKQPTLQTAAINGKRSIRFDGGDVLKYAAQLVREKRERNEGQ